MAGMRIGSGIGIGSASSWGLGATLAVLGCGGGGGATSEGATEGASTGTTTAEPGDTTLGPVTMPDTGSGSGSDTLTGPTDGGASSSSGDDSLDDSGTTGEATTGSSSEGSSSGGEAAPSVQSTAPGDLQSGVAADTEISITFSEPMDPATLTANTVDDACSGSVQVSADGFATCVPMAAEPDTADDQTFVLLPAAPLASSTTYQVRVLATATDARGTPMAADFTTGTGFIVRYFHTILVDGFDDFEPGETLPTSTAGHTGYVAWDDTFLYLGIDSVDLGVSSDQVWWTAYLGGAMGSTDGVLYNTQQPALPFAARYHLRWRADDTFGGALEFVGGAWQDAVFALDPTDVGFMGSFLELRVAWADLGSPAYLDLHTCVLREQPLDEASWAAVPEASFVDGYDPDYTQFLQFDRMGSTPPADVLPM